MASDARKIVENVLSPNMARDIWSARYEKALPISSNAFELSAVLPAVLYMFRFGQRRGRGQFLDTMVPIVPEAAARTRPQRRREATVGRVAHKLASSADLQGFEGRVEQAVLGDLLLCFCVENANRREGRDQQIQRVAPAHYFASWVDLPESVTALRNVPETIVAMLAAQSGDSVEPTEAGSKTGWFPVAHEFENNTLLHAFSRGVVRSGTRGIQTSDRFDEQEPVGVDELLMVRLAQQLKAAPDRPRGNETARISNQRPIAERSAEDFSEDIRLFVRAYAELMPRYAFIDTLESCMTVGMMAILTSVVDMLFSWSDTGTVPPKHEQTPASIFVDCSNGMDSRLRNVAEQSLDDLMRRVERLPEVLMTLRLLDHLARYNNRIKKLNVRERPYATEWLNLLGEVLHERHQEASTIHGRMEDDGNQLAEALEKEYPDAAAVLHDEEGEPNVIFRSAAALTPLLGYNLRGNLMGMVDSTLQTGRPNGLARKRVKTRGGRRRPDVRSLVVSDSALDYLVHRHLLRKGRRLHQRALPFVSFLRTIRERYGLHVDAAPPGMAISNELLQENRRILERRLRDLGLLVGVNDAESMKRLRARFMLTLEV